MRLRDLFGAISGLRHKLARSAFGEPEMGAVTSSPKIVTSEEESSEHFYFEPTRFEGSLSGHGKKIPIGFVASVDGDGSLHLELDRFPYSRDAYALRVDQRPLSTVDVITLEGVSEDGHRFHTDSFSIGAWSHGSQVGAELSYQGQCYDADLVLPTHDLRSENTQQSSNARFWKVRQFRTFRAMEKETPLGRVRVGGPRQDRESQHPDGFIGIYRPTMSDEEVWWDESERFLTHLARVFSFACDTYLRPVIEERFESERTVVRINRQARASAPFLPPFHELNMRPIFECACDSFFNSQKEIEQLDPAIRWLTAPIAYDENRLLNAMSALETILDRCAVDGLSAFMGASQFKRLARKIRASLVDLNAPDGMAAKVPELNRRSLDEKILLLLDRRGIFTNDLPPKWLNKVIKQRNLIVHTGVSGDFNDQDSDTLDHTVWVREIVTRLILERLGFVGGYRSWLHRDEGLHFPSCVTMNQWVNQKEAASN